MRVTFHGVRGSTPCQSDDIRRYGGNTSCVSVDAPGDDPLLLDMGTGLRYFGKQVPIDTLFRGNCLLTHLHWDHVQGLPFFAPLLREGSSLDVYGPTQDDGRTLEVNRTATDGTRNANSKLYGAAWQVAKNLGYRRLITYTQAGESGDSLRGAGWRLLAARPARLGWDAPSRPRDDNGVDGIARTLWEAVA
jgi:phosphoribosyl 1,2-cyclic phosphodiesterase